MVEAEAQRLSNGNDKINTSNGKEDNSTTQHAVQWERQSEWLERTRAYQQTLVSQGIKGWDLMEAMTTLNLEHKIEASSHKCPGCWHDHTTQCICSKLLPPLELSLSRRVQSKIDEDCDNANQLQATTDIPIQVKIIILMHVKEYLSAGNSAKLLLQLLPDQTELFLFGKDGEAQRLYQEMTLDLERTMILWPDRDALSVADFLESSRVFGSGCKQVGDRIGDDARPAAQPPQSPVVRAIVLDGTYTQARNMHASLKKRFGADKLPVTVQLRPVTESVFHRAQKNYGKAHQQPQPLQNQARRHPKYKSQEDTTQPEQAVAQRICTAEACGLLLMELGAAPDVQARIIQAVKINNEALGYGTRGSREVKVPASH